MENQNSSRLTRIGVFYDGNYFYHVSNYYFYSHERHSRISIQGLHEFIRERVGNIYTGDDDINHAQIVDSHYFRGRLSAKEASQRGNILYYDRLFDDILMAQGVTTHYMPIKSFDGKKDEKNVDVWLSLEALEQAYYKRFDVVVLVTCDGDYVPLVRKLLSLGTAVMLLAWDFEYQDDSGFQRITRTSQDLISEVTYPLLMNDVIGEEVTHESEFINNLFVPAAPSTKELSDTPMDYTEEPGSDTFLGEVLSLKKGYGFIKYEPNNLFFHWSYVLDSDFNDLKEGQLVRYKLARNQLGALIAVDLECLGVEQDFKHNF